MFRPGESVAEGEIIKIDNKYWLFYNFNYDDFNPKGYLELCNEVFKVQIDTEKEIVGEDDLGRPIYDETPIYHETRCVARGQLLNTRMNKDDPINLPDGRINVAIPYVENNGVEVGVEFTIFDNKYKIRDIDFSNVLDGIGIIKFIAERQQN